MSYHWTQLKQSADSIVTWDALIPYVLVATQSGQAMNRTQIYQALIDVLDLPEAIYRRRYKDDPSSGLVLKDRMEFALSLHYHAGNLARPRRGIYQLTELGRQQLEHYGVDLTEQIVKQQPAYQAYERELAQRNQAQDIQDPLDDLDDSGDTVSLWDRVAMRNNQVATELRQQLIASDPFFFEQTVIDLLEAMGYSGDHGHSNLTPRSNDGGIDGVINQDPLGTRTVYLQAKRYNLDHSVGRSEVQSFYGALAAVGADRGVFMTTSQYTGPAQVYAQSVGIVLVDGIQLTDLMLRFEVGVEQADAYVVYQIDQDYFMENEL